MSTNYKIVRSKVAQLRTFESIGVMIVFFFLLAFGMNFYFYVQEASIKSEISGFEQMRAVQVAILTYSIPELYCSHRGDILKKCFDEEKVLALSKVLAVPNSNLNARFRSMFGHADINISIYNESKNLFDRDLKVYSFPKNESEYHIVRNFDLPVVVCDKFCDHQPVSHYSFAILKVRVYD